MVAGDKFFLVFLPLSAFSLFFGAPFVALAGLQTFYAPDIFEVDLVEVLLSGGLSLLGEDPDDSVTSYDNLPLFTMNRNFDKQAKDGKLSLRLFEPRYTFMARKILKDETKMFGYVHSSPITKRSAGVVVHVLSFDWKKDDSVNIVVEAGQAFTVEKTWKKNMGRDAALLMGKVSVKPHTPASKLAAERRAAEALSELDERRSLDSSLSGKRDQAQPDERDGEAVMANGASDGPASSAEHDAELSETDIAEESDPMLTVEDEGSSQSSNEKRKAWSDRPPPDVWYHRGQVMKHKKYGYTGIIFKSDRVCLAPESWIDQMGVDQLSNGRNQPFYRVLVDVKDRPGKQETYVAQENVGIIAPRQPVMDDDPRVTGLFDHWNDAIGEWE